MKKTKGGIKSHMMKRALELLEGKAKWQAMTRDEKKQERQCHRQN